MLKLVRLRSRTHTWWIISCLILCGDWLVTAACIPLGANIGVSNPDFIRVSHTQREKVPLVRVHCRVSALSIQVSVPSLWHSNLFWGNSSGNGAHITFCLLGMFWVLWFVVCNPFCCGLDLSFRFWIDRMVLKYSFCLPKRLKYLSTLVICQKDKHAQFLDEFGAISTWCRVFLFKKFSTFFGFRISVYVGCVKNPDIKYLTKGGCPS